MKIVTKSVLFVLFALSTAANSFGQQASYSGFVGDQPVTMVTDMYSDGVARATYAYDNFDEPIKLDGRLNKKKLSFIEKNARQATRATLTFGNFDQKDTAMNGVWKDAKTGKTLEIKLKKDFEFGYGADESRENEIIQTDSLPGRYFKVVVKGDRAIAVKIFEKKTDQLIQKIDLDCQQRNAESVSVDDFNFDGIKDFSIFESSYAGPNTSSLYYLYDPAKKQFFDSKWEGVSLEFDAKKKRIFERNSCCAGSIVTNAAYRVVRNKMVLVSETCFKLDERRGEMVKRPMKQCR